jgi:hypothetical protein
MPRRVSLPQPTAPRIRPLGEAAATKSLPPAVDSQPRDWSEAGRRVLAEAQRRATDELIRRGAVPAPVVPQFSRAPAVPPRQAPLAPEVSS